MNKTCTECGARLLPQERFCGDCGMPVTPGNLVRASTEKRRGQRLNVSFSILIAGILLLAAGAAAYLTDRDIDPAAAPTTSVPPRSDIPYPQVERIALTEAKARFDSGTALFLDVRIIESYERGHIPNAVSMPLTVLTTRHRQLAQADEILIYCT